MPRLVRSGGMQLPEVGDLITSFGGTTGQQQGPLEAEYGEFMRREQG